MPAGIRRSAAVTAVLVLLLVIAKAFGDRGWSGDAPDDVTLSGVVEEMALGGARGELRIQTDRGVWVVVLGPPLRNRRAGVTEGAIRIGATVTAHGQLAPDRPAIKAARLEIGEQVYDLYPDR
jgi:hypothetical protein